MVTIDNVRADMIANNLVPYSPTHPGELVRDELNTRHMSQAELARQIDVRPSLLNEVVKGKRSVNTELALLLEAALGIPADVWLNLQSSYDLQTAKQNPSFLARLASIRRIVAAF